MSVHSNGSSGKIVKLRAMHFRYKAMEMIRDFKEGKEEKLLCQFYQSEGLSITQTEKRTEY